MLGHVHVRRIRIQGLAEDQERFPMRVPAGFKPTHAGRERKVAGHLFADELKAVSLCPEVAAASGNQVSSGGWIIHHRSGVAGRADVLVCGKEAEIHGLSRQDAGANKEQGNYDEGDCLHIMVQASPRNFFQDSRQRCTVSNSENRLPSCSIK